MSIQLLNIGFGNMVSANRVMAIISPESAPITVSYTHLDVYKRQPHVHM